MSGEERRLRSLPGGGADPAPADGPALSRPLTSEERERVELGCDVASALVDGLTVLEAAWSAPTIDVAIDRAGVAAAALGDDVTQLQRAVAVLAVEAVWRVPGPSTDQVRTGDEVAARQRQLQTWGWDRRRSAMRVLRRGRDLLRGGRR